MKYKWKGAGLLKSALVGAAALGAVSFAGFAQATPTISIGLQQTGTNGGALTTVAGPAPAPGGTGIINYSYGTFNINSITSSGDLLPGDNFGTTSINTSTSLGGTLTVWATETGITNPSPLASILSGFTLNNDSGAFQSTAEYTYVDPSNTAYGTSNQLSTASFTGIGSHSETSAFLNLLGPYSITERFVITMTGVGTSNATITMQAVPEPGALVMFGAGLLGLVVVFRWRRKSR